MKFARRAAVAAVMAALAIPSVVLADGSDDFVDVPDGAFYDAAVGAIFDAGITGGCATGPARYCPNDPMTRAQMAVFLDRILGHPAAVVDAATLDGLDATAFVRTDAAIDADTLGGLGPDAFAPAGVLHLNHADWSFTNDTLLVRGMGLGGIPNGSTITSIRVRAFDVDGNSGADEMRLGLVPFQVGAEIDGGFSYSLVPPAGFGSAVTEHTVTGADLAAVGFPTIVDHDTGLWGIDGINAPANYPPFVVQISVFYTMP